jgi:hypothetical protein
VNGRAWCACALLVLTATARADEASGRVHVAPVLPTFQLATNTDGTSTLKVALDLLIGLNQMWDLDIAPTFIANTTGGLGNLFSFNGNSLGVGTPWTVGLQLAFNDIGAESLMDPVAFEPVRRAVYNACGQSCDCPTVLPALCEEGRKAWFKTTGLDGPGMRGPYDIVKGEAVRACQYFCSNHPLDDSCKRFADAPADPRSVSPEKLCDEGLRIWLQKYDRPARERRGRFPIHSIALGASFGASQQSYLTPDPTKPQDPMNPTLISATGNKFEARAAFSYTHVAQATPLTVEVPLTYRYTSIAATQTARYCAPAGNATLAALPVESCTERPLGAPSPTHDLFLATYVGYVDKPDAFWRASAGPALDYQHHDGNDYFLLALQVPVYLNFASAPSSYTGDFKGVIQATPSIGLAVGPTGNSLQLGVMVGVVARRSVFPKALEWLN